MTARPWIVLPDFRDRPHRWWGVGLLLGTFALYAGTTSPYPASETDSALLTVYAAHLRPYLTGYPLYLLLSRLFLTTPMISPAYATNLFSALCASIAVVFTYAGAARFTGRPSASFFAALLAGLTPLLWKNAIITEVYSMMAAFAAAITWLALKALDTREPRWVGWLLFTYGLSFSHHLLTVTLAPAILLVLLVLGWRTVLDRRAVAGAVLGGVATAALYALAFLRAFADPFADVAAHAAQFLGRMTGGDYHGIMFKDDLATVVGLNLPRFWVALFEQFHPIALWPAIVFIPVLLFRRAAKTGFLLLLIAGNLVFTLSYTIPDIADYYLPILGAAAILMAGAFAAFLDVVDQTGPRRVYRLAFLLIGALLSYNTAAANRRVADDRTESSRIYDMRTQAVLDAVPDGAALLIQEDKLANGVAYQVVHNAGKRAVLVRRLNPAFSADIARDRDRARRDGNRPFYFVGAVELMRKSGVPFVTVTAPVQTLAQAIEEVGAETVILVAAVRAPGEPESPAWKSLAVRFGTRLAFATDHGWAYCAVWTTIGDRPRVVDERASSHLCDLIPAPDPRAPVLARTEIHAGTAGGTAASDILVGEKPLALQDRGVNVVLVRPRTGEVVRRLHTSLGDDLQLGKAYLHHAIEDDAVAEAPHVR
jgi:hypothetical protein